MVLKKGGGERDFDQLRITIMGLQYPIYTHPYDFGVYAMFHQTVFTWIKISKKKQLEREGRNSKSKVRVLACLYIGRCKEGKESEVKGNYNQMCFFVCCWSRIVIGL